jgi:outer membrane receptor protein involved in Fe transport
LKEVVARSVEIGARGLFARDVSWQLGAFHTVNKDDILFQTVGGSLANVGYFQNAADTRRRGIEIGLGQDIGAFGWKFDYTLLDATYRDGFEVLSPNHPLGGEDDDDAGGALEVQAGNRLPGLARHQANLRLDYRLTEALRVGADLQYRSGVYLRGDEINTLDTTGSFTVLNLHGECRFSDALSAYVRIENVLDTKYETFGLLGEPDEVFEDFEDPRFYGSGPPRGVWLGLRLRR